MRLVFTLANNNVLGARAVVARTRGGGQLCCPQYGGEMCVGEEGGGAGERGGE